MTTPSKPVVSFRRYSGLILALFPGLSSGEGMATGFSVEAGWTREDAREVIANTPVATAEERSVVENTLRQIGYDFEVVEAVTRDMLLPR